jgi:hypothetical protein
MVPVDVEVVRKKEMCWLYGKFRGGPAIQGNVKGGGAEGKYSYRDNRNEF